MEEPRYTIDELAARTGLASSTIRYYQQEGLMAVPVHEGRRAFYGEAHVRELEEVVDLTERGFSLSAIGELRAAAAEGRSLAEVLHSPELDRTQATVEMTWRELAVRVMGEAGAAVSLPDDPASSPMFATPIRLGIVVPTDRGTVHVHVAALELGDELRGLGIPRNVLLERHVALREVLDEAAALLLGLYRERVGDGPDRGNDDEFVRLARKVVDLTFLGALDAARRAEAGGRPGQPDDAVPGDLLDADHGTDREADA